MTFEFAQVGQAGTNDPQVIHPAMLVKTSILNGQHGVLHHLGYLVDRREVTPLLSKLANQRAFDGKDT